MKLDQLRKEMAKEKEKCFENGRMLRGQRDNLRNQVLRLRAEQEWVKIIQANIEAEWSKMGEQLNILLRDEMLGTNTK